MICTKCNEHFPSSTTIQTKKDQKLCRSCYEFAEIKNLNEMFNINPSSDFMYSLRKHIDELKDDLATFSFRDKVLFFIEYLKYRCIQAPIRIISVFCLLFVIFILPAQYLKYLEKFSPAIHTKNNPQALSYWQMPADKND